MRGTGRRAAGTVLGSGHRRSADPELHQLEGLAFQRDLRAARGREIDHDVGTLAWSELKISDGDGRGKQALVGADLLQPGRRSKATAGRSGRSRR